jgi:hypothetical protein
MFWGKRKQHLLKAMAAMTQLVTKMPPPSSSLMAKSARGLLTEVTEAMELNMSGAPLPNA